MSCAQNNQLDSGPECDFLCLLAESDSVSSRYATPESEAAFAKLVETRARLNEVSRKLYDAMKDRAGVPEGRYRELHVEWAQALRDLELATGDFSAIIKELNSEAGSW